jgi:hypothetical protein
MNRRANIPVTILVLLVLALIIVALVLFQQEGGKTDRSIGAFREIRQVYQVADVMSFSGKSLGAVQTDLYSFSSSSYASVAGNVHSSGNDLVYGRQNRAGVVVLKVVVPAP